VVAGFGLASVYIAPLGKFLIGSAGIQRSMLIFGVAATVLTLGVSVVAAMLLTSLTSSRELLSILMAPLALVLMTIVQGSLYPMYRAVFDGSAAQTA